MSDSKFATKGNLLELASAAKEKYEPKIEHALPVSKGGTGATTAAAAVVNIVDGQALKPASVAATGEVSGKSGTTTHKLTDKAESSAVAYVEGTTATKNHAVGDYFILGGVLMKATAAIATGETITTSNATPATVQAQIDAIRDSVSENILPSATGANNVRFSRCYKTCTVNVYLTGSIEFTTSYKWIATVPTNARPANDLYAPVFDDKGKPLNGTLCIARNGNVGIRLSATATPFVLTSIAWVA